MESLRKASFTLLTLAMICWSVASPCATDDTQNDVKKIFIKTAYFNKMFGHIHQSSSRYSQSLSTIACGHPLKVFKTVSQKGDEQSVFGQGWSLITTGPYEGYVAQAFIDDKKPSCFQDRYPKFFEALSLDLTDMYYWGRLNDQFDHGHSKVNQ